MINISLLASCKKEGKINAIYYILPQQVQVCAHASLCVLKVYNAWAENCVIDLNSKKYYITHKKTHFKVPPIIFCFLAVNSKSRL